MGSLTCFVYKSGLGGGFNERGKVEYRSYNSDEDEYDKFGRPKKNARKTSVSSSDDRSRHRSTDERHRKPSFDEKRVVVEQQKRQPIVVEHKSEVEDEEEEEDEGDEDDLVILGFL